MGPIIRDFGHGGAVGSHLENVLGMGTLFMAWKIINGY